MMPAEDLGTHTRRLRSFPEIAAGGFSRIDTTVAFYLRITALLRPEMTVLDFGAGRGQSAEDTVPFRRQLSRLKGRASKVIGVDVDPVVTTNPDLDEAHVLTLSPTGAVSIPIEDRSVDLIVSSFVFEHVSDPDSVASELFRVLRPGGWVCAMTPNRWGYIGIGNQLVPEAMKKRLLAVLQPHRQEEDVFPTVYRLNDRAALRRAFPADRWLDASFTHEPEPAYAGRSAILWYVSRAFAGIVPPPFRAMRLIFMQRKPE